MYGINICTCPASPLKQIQERGQQIRLQQEADGEGELRGDTEVLSDCALEGRRGSDVQVGRVERVVELQCHLRKGRDDEGQEVQEQTGGEDLRRRQGEPSEAAGEHRVLHGHGRVQGEGL